MPGPPPRPPQASLWFRFPRGGPRGPRVLFAGGGEGGMHGLSAGGAPDGAEKHGECETAAAMSWRQTPSRA